MLEFPARLSASRHADAFQMTSHPPAQRASGQASVVLLGLPATLGSCSNDAVLSAVLAGVVAHLVHERAYTLARCSLITVICGFICWLSFLARTAMRLRGANA